MNVCSVRHSLMYWLVCMILQTVCILDASTSSGRICTDLSNLEHVNRGVRLKGYTFKTVTAEGVMACAQQCRNRLRCKSFNFNSGQELCDLNEEVTISDDLETHTGFIHSNINDFPMLLSRSCSDHDCSINERCEPDDVDGYRCILEYPTSCAEVKTCSPGSIDDDYLIYLANSNMVRIPVYCHNMSSIPLEYVTLILDNYGTFPKLSNEYCLDEMDQLFGSCQYNWGDVRFAKIRVDIENMNVVQDDYTFATYENNPRLYGVAQDCYSRHEGGQRSSCGPVGTFTLDLRGTGFAVASEVTWDATGYKAYASVDQSSDNRRVEMLCGGYPGYCEPRPSLRLTPNDTDVWLTGVTEVTCDL